MIGIAMSTYQNETIIGETIRSLQAQTSPFCCIIADDGSTDQTVETIRRLTQHDERFEVIALPHGERGIARKTAIDRLKALYVEYLYIIDSDMVLSIDLLKSCLLYLEAHLDIGALVIPEQAYSDHSNFFSQVKVFERNLFNIPTDQLDAHSIEAARFWRLNAYVTSGEIDPTQISFEETQPTIRYLEQGGQIRRATFTFVRHNEKQVELSDLLQKKRYYFEVMPTTLQNEESGLAKALQRWYFFRPVLYHKTNLKKYVRHPFLAAGVIYMYIRLSFIGVESLVFKRVS